MFLAAFTGHYLQVGKNTAYVIKLVTVILGKGAYVKKTLRIRKSQLNVSIWVNVLLIVLPLRLFLKGLTMQICSPVCPMVSLYSAYEGTKRKWTNSKVSDHWGPFRYEYSWPVLKTFKTLSAHNVTISLSHLKHSIIQDVFYWFFNFSLSHQSSPSPSVKEWSIL